MCSLLEVVVVVVGLGTELDRLDLDLMGILLRLSCLLALFVLELAEIHDPADRRASRRCDLDEIEAPLLCELEGFARVHDSELFSLLVHDKDAGNSDHAINT